MAQRNKRFDVPEQIRIEEDLYNDVIFIARVEGRGIGGQILKFVRDGVQSYKRNSGQFQSDPVSPAFLPQSVPVRSGQRKSGAA